MSALSMQSTQTASFISSLTRALTKSRHMEKQPVVAIAGEWFTAHGRAVNLGPWGKEANQPIARTLKRAFAAWIDNGHHDLQDVNTCIVRIDLTDGALFSHGTRYDIGGE